MVQVSSAFVVQDPVRMAQMPRRGLAIYTIAQDMVARLVGGVLDHRFERATGAGEGDVLRHSVGSWTDAARIAGFKVE